MNGEINMMIIILIWALVAILYYTLIMSRYGFTNGKYYRHPLNFEKDILHAAIAGILWFIFIPSHIIHDVGYFIGWLCQNDR